MVDAPYVSPLPAPIGLDRELLEITAEECAEYECSRFERGEPQNMENN